MRTTLWVLVTSLTLLACSEGERGDGQWPISRDELRSAQRDPGEATYARYCVGCHGVDGRGNGGLTGADFTATDSPLKSRGDAELIASVRDGKRGEAASMPAHSPVLTEAQIEAVVGYVRKRFGSEPVGSEPGAQAQP